MKRAFVAAALAVVLVCIAGSFRLAAAQEKSPGYKVLATWNIGGEGGWDYVTVDPESRRVYVSHATHVVVLDADSGKIVGDIADTPGVHGIAVAHDLGLGFVSNGRDNTVSVVNLNTLRTIKKIPVGTNPDAILFDPASARVFVFNGRSNDASVIDPGKMERIGTISLDGKPEFAVSDGKGTVYVNLEDKNAVAAIDAAGMRVKGSWSIAPCESPSGLAIDRAHMLLFSVCSNKLMAASDPATGKLVATVSIGSGTDGAAYDPDNQFVFSSNGEGTLSIIHEYEPLKYDVVQTAKTARGARTCAFDPKTHHVFLPTAEFGPAPAATPENPRPRPQAQPNSFKILVVGK